MLTATYVASYEKKIGGGWHNGPQTLTPPCVAGSAGVVVAPLPGKT